MPPQELAKLYAQCRYAFYPAYRGATLRNSSISTNLAYGCVLYSHTTDITPDCLLPSGQYHQAMVLFNESDYSSYAKLVFNDITEREADLKTLNESWRRLDGSMSINSLTLKIASKLLENELSTHTISKKHAALYEQVLSLGLSKPSISGFWSKPATTTESLKSEVSPGFGQ